ncbi:MAG: RNA polymerase sigma factor [Bacteroidaceae bacterium]
MDNLRRMTDEQLVMAYSKGDNASFDALLGRYEEKLFSYIFFYVRNQELAEDIFQDTFVKAIVTIKQGRYAESGKFQAWITRIAHNLIIDYFRQEKNENLISNDETDVDLLNNINLSEGTIERALIEGQIRDDVRALVRLLPDNQREVVYMRFYQNLSFKEIAEQTNTSINTALGRMRYAILNLRRMAEEKNVVLTLD